MIEMRFSFVAALLAASLFMPLAAAHGANDFSIILRSSSMQPNEAEVFQNDSVTFYNVADENRTIRVDLDGDGIYDQRCETAPYNSSSVKDECSFMIYAESWDAGNYLLDVFSNETLWETLNLTVIHDYHEELGPPSDYIFNNGTVDEEDGGGTLPGFTAVTGLASVLGAALKKRGGKVTSGGGFAEESSNIPTDLFGIGLASEEEW